MSTDFTAVPSTVEAIFARGGSLVSVDDRQTVASETRMGEAVAAWKLARKRGRIAGIQRKGGRISADKKALAAAGVERIRQYWGMPADEYPTMMLRKMAGTEDKPMAYNTIVAHIGYGRELAQKRLQAVAKRKATLKEPV